MGPRVTKTSQLLSLSSDASDAADPRSTQLLDGAEAVFSRSGLRGATMEDIARQAGVAKATAYARFANKEEAFRKVAARLAQRMVRVAEAELIGDGPAAVAVARSLGAKQRLAWQVAHSSPHASDLLEAGDRLAAEHFAAAEHGISAAIAKRLRTDGFAEAARTARVLLEATDGLAGKATSANALQKDIDLLVSAALVGWKRVEKT